MVENMFNYCLNTDTVTGKVQYFAEGHKIELFIL